MEIFLFYILTGLAGGLIGGFLGLGGGIVFVPSLLLIFTSYNIYEGYELQSAIITSLGCVFISSLSAMITHNKNNLILWDAFNKTSLGISVGVLVGIFLLSNSATESLKNLYSFLLIMISIFMIYQKTPKDKTRSKYKYVHSFSMFVGSISTLLGIGGGTLTTPYFNFHGEDTSLKQITSFNLSLTRKKFDFCGECPFLKNCQFFPKEKKDLKFMPFKLNSKKLGDSILSQL